VKLLRVARAREKNNQDVPTKMPDDTSALRKAEKTKRDLATQQTPEIAFIHTPKGRILISLERNFLEFSELMNNIIKKKRDSRT
jgi:hypothetical protein